MKGRIGKLISFGVALLVLSIFIGGCGSKETSDTGAVSVAITDAPGLDYDHVWITVKEVWFHKLADAGDPKDPDWLKFPLPTPQTIDLATLAYGNTQNVWSGISLPVGTYRQIRVVLVSTESASLASLPAGVSTNNQVDFKDSTGATLHSPLRIPTPDEGIRIVPETPIVVTAAGNLKLALDFNVDHDVVKVKRGGTIEFILKPRLGYFDMNNAGAITGKLAPSSGTFDNYTGKNFVIKAEQPNRIDGTYRVVRRATTIKPDGSFILYPLPVFDNATTARYDIVLRGRNVQTRIVTGVPVHRGTTATTGTDLGPTITMDVDTFQEYTVGVNVKPTGSWVNFYQTLASDSVPYEIRYRHVNPYDPNGNFFEPIQLSADPIYVGAYSGGAITFSKATTVEGDGKFTAVAQAILYNRTTPQTVTSSSSSPVNFGTLLVSSPWQGNIISGSLSVTMPLGVPSNMTNGLMLATFGGMIVDSQNIGSIMMSGGIYPQFTLPGGSSSTPLPGAFYGMYGIGWSSNQIAAGAVRGIDLRTGNATANIQMFGL